jgi:hypothetical protein
MDNAKAYDGVFNLKKLNEAEEYENKISNRFAG